MPLIIEKSAGGIVYKRVDDAFLWLVIQNKGGSQHWGFPKGHVGDKVSSEGIHEAAIREVQEEGGIKALIINDKPIAIQYFFKSGINLHKKTVYYFLMEYTEGDTKNHDTEVFEAKFVPEKELLEILTYKNDKDAFIKMRDKITD